MQDKDKLENVEVRFRRNKDYGTAIDSVDTHKVKKIISTAHHYPSKHQLDAPTHFDVVDFDASPKPE